MNKKSKKLIIILLVFLGVSLTLAVLFNKDKGEVSPSEFIYLKSDLPIQIKITDKHNVLTAKSEKEYTGLERIEILSILSGASSNENRIGVLWFEWMVMGDHYLNFHMNYEKEIVEFKTGSSKELYVWFSQQPGFKKPILVSERKIPKPHNFDPNTMKVPGPLPTLPKSLK